MRSLIRVRPVLAVLAALVASGTPGGGALAQIPGGLAPAAQTRVTVDVPVASLADWVRIRASLERLPDGLTAAIEAVSTGGAVVTFAMAGDRPALVAAVQRAGFRWREASPRPVVTAASGPG